MQLRGRTIVESPTYGRLKEEYKDSLLIDELQRSFDLRLANDPLHGVPVPGHENTYVFTTDPYRPRVPSFRILYRYDKENPEEIELLALEALPFEEEAD